MWNKILNYKFHIGWLIAVLGIILLVLINLLVKQL